MVLKPESVTRRLDAWRSYILDKLGDQIENNATNTSYVGGTAGRVGFERQFGTDNDASRLMDIDKLVYADPNADSLQKTIRFVCFQI